MNGNAVRRFSVVPGESTLSFFVKTSVGTVYGKTQKLEGIIHAGWDDEGRLVTDPMPRMHVEFSVDTLTCGNAKKDVDLWPLIDCAKFPKISGDLVSIANPSGQIHIAAGRIAVGGVARSYEGSLLVKRVQGGVVVDGFITIALKDFNIKETRFLPFGTNSDVKIRMVAAARG